MGKNWNKMSPTYSIHTKKPKRRMRRAATLAIRTTDFAESALDCKWIGASKSLDLFGK